ncbi:GNAT family N-acetyltransferase [Monaibacterium marinum]|uniref:GNAT family N-acetyltransferase n=1 Tax=Pontivivens marinum TaxID=1690039 RepID=UPI0011AF46E1|nr:GNAT family N-acetyltransferase [Monaibacterium marinum]
MNRFDCGANPLNVFLKNKAKSRSKRLEYKVVVATLDGSPNCIGYYALQVGSDSIPESSKYKQKDYATNYPAFPAINLTYLAVQGQGLGEYLLNHIFAAVGIMVEHVGFYALTVQSFDEKSTKFYEKIGFKEYSEGGGQPKMLYPVTSIIQILENHPQRN